MKNKSFNTRLQAHLFMLFFIKMMFTLSIAFYHVAAPTVIYLISLQEFKYFDPFYHASQFHHR